MYIYLQIFQHILWEQQTHSQHQHGLPIFQMHLHVCTLNAKIMNTATMYMSHAHCKFSTYTRKLYVYILWIVRLHVVITDGELSLKFFQKSSILLQPSKWLKTQTHVHVSYIFSKCTCTCATWYTFSHNMYSIVLVYITLKTGKFLSI